MLKKERQAYIMHQVNLHNKVLSSYLNQQMNVSEDTIRRDLQELDQEGKLTKVHGGAISNAFKTIAGIAEVYSAEEKKMIAKKAASLIQDGMFVLTSGGTTIIEMAKVLPPNLKATFFTVSLSAALQYSNHASIEVIMIGDKISKDSRIAVGAEAVMKISQIRADLCFLGVNAIDLDAGMTDSDREVVQIKKAMIKTSKKVVALSISEKINTSEQLKICELDEIDVLITELDANAEKLKPYGQKGTLLI